MTRYFLAVTIALAGLLAGGLSWQRATAAKTIQVKAEETGPVAVKAKKRGSPHINFSDGTELTLANNGAATGAPGVALTAADFDSDGVPDVVMADAGGKLRFLHGNGLQSFGKGEPFQAVELNASLGIAPDYLFAGDYNADGQQDILAAAKNSNSLALLSGDGHAKFSPPYLLAVAGNITAIITGEIGRKDGQTDVAVAVTNRKGAFLLVYEHPEGAFKHKAEIFPLSAPATDLAIGNLDEDFYADVAVACDNDLTIVHGRGQVYPWDLIPEVGIKRPAAFVATRKMPFAISALAVGRFGTLRGATLALLGQNGNLYRLEPNRRQRPSNNKLTEEQRAQASQNLLLPTDAEDRHLATIAAPQLTSETAEQLGIPLFDTNELKGGKLDELLEKRQQEAAEKYKNTTPQEIAKIIAEGKPKSLEMRERAKRAFLRSIAGRPSTLAAWEIETLVTGSPFAGAAAANTPRKMLRVNVSDSNLDDILLVDAGAKQIQLVSQPAAGSGQPVAEKGAGQIQITALDVEGGLQAVLPLRLNLDALSDLVVLRQGAREPSVVMSAPANEFTVTSADEAGDCQGANPCSLRNAILRANSSPGMDFISFEFGGAPTTILPASELPVITGAVVFIGPADGNGNPTVEISGANVPAPADGLKIRASNSEIFRLVINRFTGVVSGASQIGGNGITIESTSASANNGNNIIDGNYLGTDRTGTISRGNSAAGLNIFDADENLIGGGLAISRNLISGNKAGISVTAGNSNTFKNNIIGLNAAGTAKLENSIGLFFAGANNTFGGEGEGDSNTVSGNGRPDPSHPGLCQREGFGFNAPGGMLIPLLIDLTTGEQLALNNVVAGNRFGTNPAGTLPFGNCYSAILTLPFTQTTIGSITPSGRNIIADNGFGAISCTSEGVSPLSEGGFCAIAGNNIGTDITGTVAMANDYRNYLSGVDRNRGNLEILNNVTYSYIGAPGGTTPGGACTGFCNLYAGNNSAFAFDDIYFTGYGTAGIFNNYIGTNQQGNQALANHSGIALDIDGAAFIGAVGTDDNNAPISLGNLISGNSGRTIRSGVVGSGTLAIQGNRIGTDVSGTFAIPNENFDINNLQPTISITTSINTGFTGQVLVGGANPLARNIISGNNGHGIFCGLPGGSTKIANNLIGLNSSLNPLGNRGNGIVFKFGFGVNIGGTDQEANQIAYNGTPGNNMAGVLVSGFNANGAARGIKIRNNLIHDNAGLGIDLNSNFAFTNPGGDGVTPNDCDDTDAGANDLQNYPELIAPTQNGNGTVTVQGVLRSLPGRTYALDFYSNTSADASNYGEGANPIGSLNVTTGSGGFVSFTFTSAQPVSASLPITATATDDLGNTSEFSCVAGQCTAGLTTLEQLAGVPPVACISPIVVNVTTDAPDTDGDQPDNNLRDGICDSDAGMAGSQCSLRAAIQEANARPGLNTITFDIPGAGVQTITPATALPDITGPAYILGSTQNSNAGGHLIKLNGAQTTNAYGLKISANASTIEGLTIVGFQKGVGINGHQDNRVENCHIGINSDGSTAPPERMAVGVEIFGGGTRNRIGGTTGATRNIISNNIVGLQISGGSNNNDVNDNRIGTNSSGLGRLPNDYGIVVDNSNFNRIGVELATDTNFIAGNNFDGVTLQNNAAFNSVSGCYIGVEIGETTDVPNHSSGVVIKTGANNNNIGGLAEANGNLIGGHTFQAESAGVLILGDAGSSNRLLYNRIGTSKFVNNGTRALPNKFGVIVRQSNQFIGRNGVGLSSPNLIVNSTSSGILLDGRQNEINETTIQGNNIGTDGANDYGNALQGIALEGQVCESDIKQNLISGNDRYGIAIINGFLSCIVNGVSNTVRGNKIGTNANGDDALANGFGGIFVQGRNNKIGGASGADANLISGNLGNGILVEARSTDTKILKNLIGTTGNGANPLGNDQSGIKLFGSNAEVTGNTISGNFIGLTVARGTGDPEVGENRIAQNLIGTNSTGGDRIPNQTGVTLTGAAMGNFVEDNVISGNFENGVNIVQNSGGNTVRRNLIGTTKDGLSELGNGLFGVFVESDGNTIGGDLEEDGNVISGNTVGVRISKSTDAGTGDAASNTVQANLIGTNKSGTAAIPNARSGIEITGGAQQNRIGGGASQGNLVSGNGNEAGTTGRGVYIFAADADDPNGTPTEPPHDNIIIGNYVGSNAAHTAAIPNKRTGILIFDSPDNVIGNDATESTGNVVVGNLLHGIAVQGVNATGNNINYNFVGVTREGVAIGNNPDGINADQAPGTIIGNNNVCGNARHGISVSNVNANQLRTRAPDGSLLHSIVIKGNLVGVFNDNGAARVIANALHGIELNEVSNALVGVSDQAESLLKNILSGNGGAGLLIRGSTSSLNTINNCFIGTDGIGTAGLGNGAGVIINNAARTIIGDLDNELRNTIANNQNSGVVIDGVNAVFNRLKNNLIKANGAAGVLITEGARLSEVGGTEANSGNTISENGGAGVRIDETAGHCNLVDPNSIFGNTGLGIDIGAAGISSNDLHDADEGANRGQNYPEIVNFLIDSNGDLFVRYKLDTAPANANYGAAGLYVEFFQADASGQGRQFIGFDHYTVADYNAGAPGLRQINLGNAAALGVTLNDRLTATATDADNNTSEFYPALVPTAADAAISGRVTAANGQGLANVTLTLRSIFTGASNTTTTDSAGEYRFTGVTVGLGYILTPSATGHSFTPPNRFFTLLTDASGIDFVAQPGG